MGGILSFLEVKNGSLRKVSYEILSVSRSLSEALGIPNFALVIADEPKKLKDSVDGHAENVILVGVKDGGSLRPDILAQAVRALHEKYSFSLVFGPHTLVGRYSLSKLSVFVNWAFVPDVIGINLDGEDLILKKPVFGGRLISSIKVKAKEAVITFRPNSFAPSAGGLKTNFISENVEIRDGERIKLLAVKSKEERKVDLQEADFIICGGRGMKSPENFKILEEIAEIMGGRVGASRAVVDAKWRDYEDQIGKSGKTVSPVLYVGCGVSGAVHHTMGIDSSKVIVAINSDPKAPIFDIADYGIVDDLFAILPILKEELKKVKEKA